MARKCGRLCPFSFGLAMGIFWAVAVFVMGVIADATGATGGYGTQFVTGLGTVYIGYQATFWGSVIGGIWAFIDGFFCGLIFAWLYNVFCGKHCESHEE